MLCGLRRPLLPAAQHRRSPVLVQWESLPPRNRRRASARTGSPDIDEVRRPPAKEQPDPIKRKEHYMARRYRKPTVPKVDPALRPAALLRYFKVSGRLMFNEVDGDLWVTDSYMAAKVPASSPLVDWLALYNLKPEPMCCTVNGTVLRIDAAPPDIAALVAKYGKGRAKFPQASRVTIGSAPVLVDDGKHRGELMEVWEAGVRFCLNPKVRRAAEVIAGEGEWVKGAVPAEPVLRVHAKKPTAMVMPMRSPGVVEW